MFIFATKFYSTSLDLARTRALALYHRILRAANRWTALSGDPAVTAQEQTYIREEARRLFKRNSTVTDPQEIEAHIAEGEARLALAIHYKNPYPRLSNLPPSALASGGFRRNQRRLKESVPTYLKSYYGPKNDEAGSKLPPKVSD